MVVVGTVSAMYLVVDFGNEIVIAYIEAIWCSNYITTNRI